MSLLFYDFTSQVLSHTCTPLHMFIYSNQCWIGSVFMGPNDHEWTGWHHFRDTILEKGERPYSQPLGQILALSKKKNVKKDFGDTDIELIFCVETL